MSDKPSMDPDRRKWLIATTAVGGVGGNDPVLPVQQNVRLGQGFQVRHQLGQRAAGAHRSTRASVRVGRLTAR